jgi:hypothetical protein
VPYRRHQVGQRLAGAGSGLDGQVLAGLDGQLDRLGHRDLSGAFLAADVRHGRREQIGHGREIPFRHPRTVPRRIPEGTQAVPFG